MEKVTAIPWVNGVTVKMTAQPAKPLIADDVPAGLKKVSNIIAVSSCKVCAFAFFCTIYPVKACMRSNDILLGGLL